MVMLDDFQTHTTHQKKTHKKSPKKHSQLPSLGKHCFWLLFLKAVQVVQAINCLPYPIFTAFPPAISHGVCTYGISNSHLNALTLKY